MIYIYHRKMSLAIKRNERCPVPRSRGPPLVYSGAAHIMEAAQAPTHTIPVCLFELRDESKESAAALCSNFTRRSDDAVPFHDIVRNMCRSSRPPSPALADRFAEHS